MPINKLHYSRLHCKEVQTCSLETDDDIFSRCVFSPQIPLFWGLGEMAAGTSNDDALLKSPECSTDECAPIKWECLRSLFYYVLLSAGRFILK